MEDSKYTPVDPMIRIEEMFREEGFDKMNLEPVRTSPEAEKSPLPTIVDGNDLTPPPSSGRGR